MAGARDWNGPVFQVGVINDGALTASRADAAPGLG